MNSNALNKTEFREKSLLWKSRKIINAIRKKFILYIFHNKKNICELSCKPNIIFSPNFKLLFKLESTCYK